VDVKRAKLGRKQTCGHFSASDERPQPASQPRCWSVFPAALVHREPSLSAIRSATVARPPASKQVPVSGYAPLISSPAVTK